ncbi:MAG TPA: co-chaperone GroES [Bacteroidales bacterium]|jgi:chaperonin GroES|nr:co-chaperone GroES [Bacteroidales bacterium]HOS70955.1 co-chaperone GroES [Bacteroidales bacterium]HQH23265.1 co-chaperone GroES [Bacteroidales bacterium]HQJ80877.1 co-chaperone GroES [Bacteroidales bacterium]
MKELQPINQLVVLDVTASKDEQRTSSGIIIPDTAKEKPKSAPVVWMGVIENAEIKPGDVVLYKPFAGTEIEFEGKEYLILPYADVLAKVVETEKI